MDQNLLNMFLVHRLGAGPLAPFGLEVYPLARQPVASERHGCSLGAAWEDQIYIYIHTYIHTYIIYFSAGYIPL